MSWAGEMAARRDAVARAFGLDPSAIVGRSRKKHVTRARHAAAFVLRSRYPGASLKAIGKVIGVKDHTSVRWSIMTARAMRERDAAYREATDALIAQDIPAPLPLVLVERVRAGGETQRARPLTAAAINRRLIAEIRDYPEPQPHKLNIQLKGQDGCPRLSGSEIARRRRNVEVARRARELALLEIEAARYGLPRRAKALSEMAA